MPVDPKSGGLYTIDMSQLSMIVPIIKEIEKHGERIDKPLKVVAVYMTRQTDKSFDQGGRETDKWAPLSPYTLAMREHAGRARNPKKILQVTGTLRGDIKFELMEYKNNRAVHGFTRTPYAAIQQHGGKVKIDAKTIVPKNKKALAFFVDAGRGGGQTMIVVKKVVIPARTATIPPRPFLKFYHKDVEFAVDRLSDFRDEIVADGNDERKH